MALVTMYLLRYSKAAEEAGNQRFCHCQSLLIANGVGVWPLGKTVHSNQKVSVSLVTPWEGPCYIDAYPFKWGPDVVPMHLATNPCSGAATGCIGVTLPALLLNIVSCLEPVVHLLVLTHGPVETQVTS
jgi:hypothetical protein